MKHELYNNDKNMTNTVNIFAVMHQFSNKIISSQHFVTAKVFLILNTAISVQDAKASISINIHTITLLSIYTRYTKFGSARICEFLK